MEKVKYVALKIETELRDSLKASAKRKGMTLVGLLRVLARELESEVK